MAADVVLTQAERMFVASARSAVLATIRSTGPPRLVPICFVLDQTAAPPRIYSPLDEKPKRVPDPRDLARVRDIAANPMVALLIDRWSEDWSALGWVRVEGRADLIEPGDAETQAEHTRAVSDLRDKYPQYATHRLERRPLIRIVVELVRSWGNLGASSG
jgi:PPOX class probable F420-dependent enzyme